MDITLRPHLLKAAMRAKNSGAFDLMVRYNPYLRRRIEKLLARHAESVGAESDFLTERILKAAQATPYSKGMPADIAGWPVLAKETLRRATPDFMPPHLLPGIPASTSGTSGTPLKLWRSLECVVAEQWFIDELLKPHGVDMRRSRMAILRADRLNGLTDEEGLPAYGRFTHRDKRLTLSSSHLSADTIHWFHRTIERFNPQILWVYPSAASNLLKLLRQAGLSLKIPLVLASSEELSTCLHEAIEAQLDASIINYYGQAERACFAYSRKPGEFFFHPFYGKVELGEAQTEEGGLVSAALIGTGFWNRRMPLIRYDTGDRLFYPAGYGERERREITLGIKPFNGFAGRGDEYVLTREGMRIIGLNHIPREVEHLLQIQLIQPAYDRLDIRVIAAPEFGAREQERLTAQALSKLPASFMVTVEQVESLEVSQTGKTPYVIRRIS